MYVRVTVTPDAKRERLEVINEREFEISVREPALRNLANRRVVQIVAEHFAVPAGAVKIISGHRSPKKVLSVEVS